MNDMSESYDPEKHDKVEPEPRHCTEQKREIIDMLNSIADRPVIADLKAHNAAQRDQIAALEARVTELESKSSLADDWSPNEVAEWADEHAETKMPLDRFAWRIYAAIIRVQDAFEGEYSCCQSDLDLLYEHKLLSSRKIPMEDDGERYPDYMDPGDTIYEMTHLGHAMEAAAQHIVRETLTKGETL
jgi:hypothetical protein